MIDAARALPNVAKIILRAVGVLNLAMVLLGVSGLESAFRILTRRHWTCPSVAPYCRVALVTITLVELAFASALLLAAVRFIQAKLSAANLYLLTVAALFIYLVGVNLLLTQASAGMRMSVCGAETVVSYGPTAAFFNDWFLFVPRPYHVPFLYQVASVVLVQLLKWRYGSGQTPTGRRQIGSNTTVTEVY